MTDLQERDAGVADADRVAAIRGRILNAKYAAKYPIAGEVLDVQPSFVEDLEWLAEQAREGLRLRRMFDLVNARGSVIEPAKLSVGKVVVVDGRTGLDACSNSAEDGIEQLLAEADGEGSPSRVFFGFVGGAPHLGMYEAPNPEDIRAAIESANRASTEAAQAASCS